MTRGAFEGVKVVEYAHMVSGPYCGKLLADMGADVIKIEEPPAGDPARRRGPFPADEPHPERSGLFLYLNTSKRGITLDPEHPSGREALSRLIRWADVLIDNHPLGRLESLGVGWEALQRENRGLILTSISPYGRSGPRSRYKGGELTAYHGGALGNLLPQRSTDISRPPLKAGGYPTGYHAGLTAGLATASALLARRATGRGQLIDLSEQESIVALVRGFVGTVIYHRPTWSRVPDRPPSLGRMQCSDGYVVSHMVEDHHWRGFVELMGNPEWAAGDEWNSFPYRVANLFKIGHKIDAWALQQKAEEFHHQGAAKGFAIGAVYNAEQVLSYRQYASRGFFVDVDHPQAGKYRYAGWPYQMSASPPRVQRPAPLLGQHNEEVLRDTLGYTADEYRRLGESGALGEEVAR